MAQQQLDVGASRWLAQGEASPRPYEKLRVFLRLISLLALALLAQSTFARAQNVAPSFEARGAWSHSGVAGHEADKSTLWTNELGASALWKPNFAGPVRARVALHKIVQDKNNDARVQIEVLHGGKIETQFLNHNEGKSGWVELGTFAFSGEGEEGVRLTKISKEGATRASAVRFDLLGEGDNPQPVQTIIIDDLIVPDAPKPDAIKLPQNFGGGPPKKSDWEVTFRDEFDGDKLNFDVWQSEAGAPGHILSSRWPENLEVKNGTLRLLTKREERGGRQWSSASIWTKKFQQQYGYFEARIKIANASGLNNAFWLMTWKKRTEPHHFEIDITEAHYPHRSQMTLHNWSGEHWARAKHAYLADNLSKDFHIYALEWTPQEIIWYLDGLELFRTHNDIAHDKAPVRFSTAVAHFAGRISPALEGTQMEVDWVRVYQRKDE